MRLCIFWGYRKFIHFIHGLLNTNSSKAFNNFNRLLNFELHEWQLLFFPFTQHKICLHSFWKLISYPKSKLWISICTKYFEYLLIHYVRHRSLGRKRNIQRKCQIIYNCHVFPKKLFLYPSSI